MLKKGSSQTSWEGVSKWYDQIVGEDGHYYHQKLIIPNAIRLLNFSEKRSFALLDLACGQGVLGRHLPPAVSYVGVDISESLIEAAKSSNRNTNHKFIRSDVAQKLPLQANSFTHGSILLALQNIEDPLSVFKNAAYHLQKGSSFLIVLNHPCFRIPRQSSWKIDTENKMQYRRIDRYMSAMKIPIQANPSKGKNSSQTWSFHHPLSEYTKWLREAGFMIEAIEEWCSDKISVGSAAKMENRSRAEIPLFLAILAKL